MGRWSVFRCYSLSILQIISFVHERMGHLLAKTFKMDDIWAVDSKIWFMKINGSLVLGRFNASGLILEDSCWFVEFLLKWPKMDLFVPGSGSKIQDIHAANWNWRVPFFVQVDHPPHFYFCVALLPPLSHFFGGEKGLFQRWKFGLGFKFIQVLLARWLREYLL